MFPSSKFFLAILVLILAVATPCSKCMERCKSQTILQLETGIQKYKSQTVQQTEIGQAFMALLRTTLNKAIATYGKKAGTKAFCDLVEDLVKKMEERIAAYGKSGENLKALRDHEKILRMMWGLD